MSSIGSHRDGPGHRGRPASGDRSPPLRRAGGHGHVGDRRAPRSIEVPPRHPQGWRAPPPLRRQLRLFCPRHRRGLQGHHLPGDRCVQVPGDILTGRRVCV